MKKSLLALAVLGAFAGVASAQSSVTLYGTIDLNGRYVKSDGQDRRLTLSQDGINSSQLGFRGVEDLGGGLKAGFNLLAGVNADTVPRTPSSSTVVRPSACSATLVSCASAATTPRRSGTRRSSTRSARTVWAAR
jgi:predicted porin